MKVIKKEFNKGITPHIYTLADIHIGSKKFDFNRFREVRETILNDPNGYVVLLGDIVNNSTKSSVGDVYEEELSPMQQVQTAIRELEPLKDRILAITAGNHERRTMREDGIDLAYFMASELGLAEVYDYTSIVLICTLGAKTGHALCYTMYLTHGDGTGGRLPGTKANALQRRGDIVNADIVVLGHCHMPMISTDSYFEIDKRSTKVNQKDRLYVMTGSFLKYEEYAEIYGMRPNSSAVPMIVLDNKKFKALGYMI